MMKYLPIAIALTFGLTGCSGGLYGDGISDQGRGAMAPAVPFVPHIVDGYGNPAPELQSTPNPSAQTMPMLQDPEAESEEWSDEVWANSQEEADQACQAKADMATEEGRSVVTVIGKAQMRVSPKPAKGNKSGTSGKFVCRFRSEV